MSTYPSSSSSSSSSSHFSDAASVATGQAIFPDNQGRAALLDRLLCEPQQFSFGQVMRLLGLLFSKAYGSRKGVYERGITVIPHLSLGFPASDVVRIRLLPPGEDREGEALPRFEVTASFMGLYGSSGPLPTFYTEELLNDEREDVSAVRDFLDIINQVLYRKYYQAYAMSGLAMRAVENREPAMAEIPYCLLGMGYTPLRVTHSVTPVDLGFVSLFARHNRSAMGLEDMLCQVLGLHRENVEVEQCVPMCLPIPEEQRCLVGLANASLGENTVAGSQVMDRMGRFSIHIRNMERTLFERLQPGRPLRQALERAIALYVHDPLEYDIVLSVREGTFEGAMLGNAQWGVLGANAMLMTGGNPSPETVVVVYGG